MLFVRLFLLIPEKVAEAAENETYDRFEPPQFGHKVVYAGQHGLQESKLRVQPQREEHEEKQDWGKVAVVTLNISLCSLYF